MNKEDNTKEFIKALDKYFIINLQEYIYQLKPNSTISQTYFIENIDETKEYLKNYFDNDFYSLNQRIFIFKLIDLVYEKNLKRIENIK